MAKKIPGYRKFKVFNIDYCVEEKDLEIDEDSKTYVDEKFSSESIKKQIAEIKDSLPKTLTVEVWDDFGDTEPQDLDIADAISDETGWLVNNFDFEELNDDNEPLEKGFLEKLGKRAKRRKLNVKKALRKQKIAKDVTGIEYDNLHQYSKNQVHCSCFMCSTKTKNKRTGEKNFKPSEAVKLDSMLQQEREYI